VDKPLKSMASTTPYLRLPSQLQDIWCPTTSTKLYCFVVIIIMWLVQWMLLYIYQHCPCLLILYSMIASCQTNVKWSDIRFNCLEPSVTRSAWSAVPVPWKRGPPWTRGPDCGPWTEKKEKKPIMFTYSKWRSYSTHEMELKDVLLSFPVTPFPSNHQPELVTLNSYFYSQFLSVRRCMAVNIRLI